METRTAVRLSYLVRLLIRLAFIAIYCAIGYWVVFSWGVRNWFALGAIFLILGMQFVVALSQVPIDLIALRAIWRSEHPADLHKVLEAARNLDKKKSKDAV